MGHRWRGVVVVEPERMGLHAIPAVSFDLRAYALGVCPPRIYARLRRPGDLAASVRCPVVLSVGRFEVGVDSHVGGRMQHMHSTTTHMTLTGVLYVCSVLASPAYGPPERLTRLLSPLRPPSSKVPCAIASVLATRGSHTLLARPLRIAARRPKVDLFKNLAEAFESGAIFCLPSQLAEALSHPFSFSFLFRKHAP